MKKQEDLVRLQRSAIANQLHAVKDSITKKPPHYNMHGLVKENKLKWFFKNIAHFGNGRYPYQVYLNPGINNGIFKMLNEPGKEFNVLLLSDWASDTFESHNVAKLAGENEYSI